MTMIERVARAICKTENTVYGWQHYEDCARAAIQAMREPTEAMRVEGVRHHDTVESIWQAMIDEALEDK